MSEDLRRESEYLWDPGADPNPEIASLERDLAPLRHRGEPPDLPEEPRDGEPRDREGAPRGRPRHRRPVLIALAATLIAGLGLGIWWSSLQAPAGLAEGAWDVAVLAGSPRIDGRTLTDEGTLAPGHRLTTETDGRARLSLPSVGEVDVDAGSDLTLAESGPEAQRFHLEKGRLEAWIWAPPGVFEVDTPAARAIDLGCVYELVIDGDGRGHLAVTSGWVAVVDHGRESFVPAGARTSIEPDRGPGAPLWNDAPEGLRTAIAGIEGEDDPVRRRKLLRKALDAARVDDALTVWHLLTRVSPAERKLAAARLAELVPPPAAVELDAVLAGDRAALDAWWEALELGSASWWRHWRQPL